MKKMLFIYVDALNSNFVNSNAMPFVYNMAKEHCYQELENVIGYSFAIQSSMLSGEYPENNDHWMPYFLFSRDISIIIQSIWKNRFNFVF